MIDNSRKMSFEDFHYLEYPDYIIDKLNNVETMNSLIEKSYQSKYCDLKTIHKKCSEGYDGTIKDLFSLKLDKNIFGNSTIKDFWFIKFHNLNYLFNGDIVIPCSGIMIRDWFDDKKLSRLISILYIPENKFIKLSDGYYFDIHGLYNEILKNITNKEEIYSFLDELNYYRSGYLKVHELLGWNLMWLSNTKLNFIECIEVLDKLNSLEFLTRLYFTEIGVLELDLDKMIHSLINLNSKDKQKKLTISETSQIIFDQEEIYSVLKNNLKNLDEFLHLFEYNIVREFMNIQSTKFQFEHPSFTLDFDLYHFFQSSKLEKFTNDFSSEHINRVLKQRSISKEINVILSKFKKNYYKKISEKLREIENNIRIEKGFPVVGTLVNENILFVKLKEVFSEHRVISQGKPIWLGRQSLDIYFPDLNIGIEYQGIQHSKSVEYFGGDEGFQYRIKLDMKKKKLCKQNNCYLIEVFPDYDFEDVVNQINFIIGCK